MTSELIYGFDLARNVATQRLDEGSLPAFKT